jgi:nucleoside-diphosphate-sugar epimerase
LKILITSAGLDLPAGLANFLKDRHQVRRTDRSAVSSGLEFVRCDLGHGRGTNDLVRGMDAIIHWGQVDSRSATTAAQLDYHTRCTYNLLYAASAEKVPLLVYLSSLAIMHKYDEDLKVTEHWRPLPTTEPEVLCCHLGELVCREFVREGRIAVACLRLGEVVRRGQAPASSSALYLDDALEAVEAAISWDTGRHPRNGEPPLPPAATSWGLFHIQSPLPNARYSIRAARELLQFNPAGKG